MDSCAPVSSRGPLPARSWPMASDWPHGTLRAMNVAPRGVPGPPRCHTVCPTGLEQDPLWEEASAYSPRHGDIHTRAVPPTWRWKPRCVPPRRRRPGLPVPVSPSPRSPPHPGRALRCMCHCGTSGGGGCLRRGLGHPGAFVPRGGSRASGSASPACRVPRGPRRPAEPEGAQLNSGRPATTRR